MSLEVDSVFVGSGMVVMWECLPEGLRSFLEDEILDGSKVAGFLSHVIWTGLAHDGTWQGEWLTGESYRRIFPLVESLVGDGYSIPSYGEGWLMASITEGEEAPLSERAAALGLRATRREILRV